MDSQMYDRYCERVGKESNRYSAISQFRAARA